MLSREIHVFVLRRILCVYNYLECYGGRDLSRYSFRICKEQHLMVCLSWHAEIFSYLLVPGDPVI